LDGRWLVSWENLAEDILGEFVSAQDPPEPHVLRFVAFLAERERNRSRERRETIYAIPTLYARWLADARRWAATSYERMRKDAEHWALHLDKVRSAYHRRKKDPSWMEKKRARGRATEAKAWARKSADPVWREERRRKRREAYAAGRNA
jgi:hypothetical protein